VVPAQMASKGLPPRKFPTKCCFFYATDIDQFAWRASVYFDDTKVISFLGSATKTVARVRCLMLWSDV
jgi:hypothetical protein